MAPTLSSIIENSLLMGYLVFGITLNLVAYLISLFYQKKFGRTSPTFGFLVAVFLSAVLLIFLLIFREQQQLAQIASGVLLIGSAVSSALSTLNLYYTMKKTSK